MLRVAHFLPNMAIGGRERIVADLCRMAEAHDISPMIVTYDPLPAEDAVIETGEVPVIALDRRDPGFKQELAGALKAVRADVIHAQGHIPAALAYPALDGVPMLATVHVALGSGWRWTVPVVRGLRAATRLTAVSDDLAARFGRLARRPVETIPTGVDLVCFRPGQKRQPNTPFTVGIAARLHPVKRHGDALAALRLLDEASLSVRLLLAGEGPEAAAIAAASSGLDVAQLGPVVDMPTFLHSLDAFLLPSDHEGTPAALLEAMACGVPCIATAVGGVPALAGDAAILVPRRRPTAIADAIARLVSHPHLRGRLAEAGLARAQSFGIEHQAANYAMICHEIAASRRRAA